MATSPSLTNSTSPFPFLILFLSFKASPFFLSHSYAREVSRELYFMLEQTPREVEIALGLTLLALATSCKSVQRAAHYSSIAYNISERVAPREDDATQQKILFFIRFHYYNIVPCEPESALYFPLHGPTTIACGFSLFTTLSLEVAGVLSEVFILGQEVEKCWTLPAEHRPMMEAFAKKLPFGDPAFMESMLAPEFLHFVRSLPFLPRPSATKGVRDRRAARRVHLLHGGNLPSGAGLGLHLSP